MDRKSVTSFNNYWYHRKGKTEKTGKYPQPIFLPNVPETHDEKDNFQYPRNDDPYGFFHMPNLK